VLLGGADSGDLTVQNVIGDVGRMTLASGVRVWIVADVVTMTNEMQRGVDDIRGKMAADPSSFGWAWEKSRALPTCSTWPRCYLGTRACLITV
jgi:hypothetical protein